MNQIFPLSWILNRFSYLQTFIFICILFFLSLIPICYFWVYNHQFRLAMIDEQLGKFKAEKEIQSLFTEIQKYRLLLQRLSLTENKELKAEIETSENHIDTLLENLMRVHVLVLTNYTYAPSIWQKESTRNLQKRWHRLVEQSKTLPFSAVEPTLTSILHDLLVEFSYLSNKVEITYVKEIENADLVGNIFARLPEIQESLSQLILLAERALLTQGKETARERMLILISSLESDLAYLDIENLANASDPNQIGLAFFQIVQEYRDAASATIRVTKNHILGPEKPTIMLPEYEHYVEIINRYGSKLWSEGYKNFEGIYHAERGYVVHQLWSGLLITIFLTGIAFILGLILTISGTRRLSQLTEATDSFSNGNLSIRVADNYQDEIGRQAQAFNRMAGKLEEIIKHLYKLLDATTALANGNLTARIETDQVNPEFDQVAISFNRMAETFETIISRLQQVGGMLAASATEITTASKERETNIIKQETTTREIAIAASEISATAKEFANTMNEMSQEAEETSVLAINGKGSLTNMESIMSQMMNASSNIGSKLAVLNEKAGNITGVITTITKVADQTNLLSLNASIEAEKAGEYGRSFAVIAREIRRLADQTAIATLDIEKIVNEIMSAVSTSVMGVDDFTQEIRDGVNQVRTVSGQLAKIIEQVENFTARFELLNQGMQSQSAGADQINEALAQLSQTAKQTSEAIGQFHKTIQELDKTTTELNTLTPFIRGS